MRYLLVILLTLVPFCSVSSESISSVLHQHSEMLSQDVIKVVEKVLLCAKKNKLSHNNILTIIDYSLPSNKKRLWVFDLNAKKLLFHTYVSHAIKSGLLDTEFFSNKPQSKTTSLGIFSTENSYDGRYGLAVKLQGREKEFNNNAYERFLVIHPAWYVTERFIKKYGRLGRSWGCPAISYDLIDPIINTIKENSLLVVYYPSYRWLSKSEFLTCDKLSLAENIKSVENIPKSSPHEQRSAILFADKNKNNKRDDTDPVLVMSADNYQAIFKKPAPLSRMLRRQFKNTEYISLNISEFQQLDTNSDNAINGQDENGLNVVDFVVTDVKKIDGYWATEFKLADLEEEKEIRSIKSNPILSTPKGSILLKSTDKFIRWLGL